MRILMVNKFLYPNGGSETYIMRLGQWLSQQGHRVEYFGMEDERNTVGNSWGLYTSNREFRSGLSLSKVIYPFAIIYSVQARNKIRKLIREFRPDVVHLNNINFQITPSILYEIKKAKIPVVWTAHDYQLVCPNHSLYVHQEKRICTACLSGKYSGCLKYKCLHGSTVKSLTAMLESKLYKWLGTYKIVDKVICPSRFIKEKLETRPELCGKCTVLHNFIDQVEAGEIPHGDYVLYFGRFDKEKGIETLLSVCRELPDIPFVFAGSGPLGDALSTIDNVKNVGFQSGEDLKDLICHARFTIYPSEWYENCPFSVMESQMYGVPVIGADIGGIPELIKDKETGLLFKNGDKAALKKAVYSLYHQPQLRDTYAKNCLQTEFDTLDIYGGKLLELYTSLISRKGDK